MREEIIDSPISGFVLATVRTGVLKSRQRHLLLLVMNGQVYIGSSAKNSGEAGL